VRSRRRICGYRLNWRGRGEILIRHDDYYSLACDARAQLQANCHTAIWSPLTDFGRLDFSFFAAGRAFHEPTNVALGTMLGTSARADHFSEKIDVVICFTRHSFANLVEHS